MTRHYLSRKQVAERIGVKPDTLGRYNLPSADVQVGVVKGWATVTIDKWNAARPSRPRFISEGDEQAMCRKHPDRLAVVEIMHVPWCHECYWPEDPG